MKLGLTALALAAILNVSLSPGAHGQQQPQQQQQQPAIPDAPAPQPPVPLTGADGTPITPGKGVGTEQPGTTGSSSSTTAQPAPAAAAPILTPPPKDDVQMNPPAGAEKLVTFHLQVNFVEVPVTVKDTKGKLVAGLTFRDFKVYENNTREPLTLFTVDPAPLSIAFVVDQSLTSDVMSKVNNSLDAIQGALTPYDELAVVTYSNGAQDRSVGFTGAQSARVPFIFSMTKAAGEEILAPVGSGPMAGCSIHVNGNCADPNIQPGRSVGSGTNPMTIPKEIHTLNDAILAAAKELSTRPKGRRRVLYVISDGKEYGSKATIKEVIRYLETNQIGVYGTLVGDSARWGEGYLSRFHLPFTMYDNVLYKYIAATGGTADSERNLNGIEKSYQAIAAEARNQYTLGYNSHEPVIDGKFRKIDVRVERPGLDVTAKNGYYPNARDNQ